MTSVPAGGPATINGVLYQMLWALHRVGTLQAIDSVVDPITGELTRICLILEPPGGGDQQEVRPGQRVIEQLKARSGQGPWSLQEVVTDVLPDLYRAVDLNRPATEYRFVTEGYMGKWPQVYKFFQSLKRSDPGDDPLAGLDDRDDLTFGHRRLTFQDTTKKPFWQGPYTQRRLFQQVTEVLRQREAVAQEDLLTTQRKLWHLLGNFVFVSGQRAGGLQLAVDAWLRAVVPAAEELRRFRDALLLDLARRATAGGARIVATEFLAEHHLTALPLTSWVRISDRARCELTGTLHLRGFDAAEDVRPDYTAQVATRWTATHPILVLTGERGSGQGKTWLGHALLQKAAEQQEVAILVEATGDVRNDRADAAAIFWQRIVGHDNALPFFRIRDRLRTVSPGQEPRPLCLFIDRVTDADEARHLALERWEELGMRLVVACPPEVAVVIRRIAPDRVVEESVRDFNTEELHRYLADCAGDRWPTIPGDVRVVLHRPLLARLYRDLAGPGDWLPTHEYELYTRCWDDLFVRQGVHPQDVVPLYRLARSLLDGAAYPWSVEQAAAAGFDAGALDRLCRAGWLRSLGHAGYEVWHDRLLNWTIAQALIAQLQSDRSVADDIFARLRVWLEEPQLPGGRFLGYVPMDALWMLLVSPASMGLAGLMDRAVAVLEDADRSYRRDVLYGKLLPTLGPRVLPFLLRRLEATALQEGAYATNRVAQAVTSLPTADVLPAALRLLDDDRPRVQRAAMLLLARRPGPTALDRLWAVHCACNADPAPFLWDHEHRIAAYEDSFGALRACVALDPDWLQRAIERADPAAEPVHDLVYLLAGLTDGQDLWRRCKPALFTKVARPRERSLAAAIHAFRDADEVGWVLERIHRTDNLVGPMAFRALIRLNPELALGQVDRLPEREVYPTRNWWLPGLLAHLPDATLAHLLERMRRHPDPWKLALVFQGNENAISVPILELLLDALATRPAQEISKGLSASSDGQLMIRFNLLLAVARPELLDCLRRRRGLPLERNLTATRVVNRWMEVGDFYARITAQPLACRCPDDETIRALVHCSQSEKLRDNFPFDQGLAAEALAAMGRWPEVVAYLCRWGLETLTAVTDFRVEAGRLDDQSLAPALAAIRADGLPTPGTVLSLGFGGRTEYTGMLRDVLARESADTPVAQACALALGWLRDTDPAIVPLLARQLMLPDHRHNTIVTLLKDLRERLQAGKVYPHERIETALQNFFILANLTQLRELAMEEISRRLDRRRQEQREGLQHGGSERIMGALNCRLLRLAARPTT